MRTCDPSRLVLSLYDPYIRLDRFQAGPSPSQRPPNPTEAPPSPPSPSPPTPTRSSSSFGGRPSLVPLCLRHNTTAFAGVQLPQVTHISTAYLIDVSGHQTRCVRGCGRGVFPSLLTSSTILTTNTTVPSHIQHPAQTPAASGRPFPRFVLGLVPFSTGVEHIWACPGCAAPAGTAWMALPTRPRIQAPYKAFGAMSSK
jgi:hypothetical protein